MWYLADIASSRQVRSWPKRLYRRGIRVHCGLSTCMMATFSRWSLEQRPIRSSWTGYRSLCDYRRDRVAWSLRYPYQPCQTTRDSTPCNTRRWPPLYKRYWCVCNIVLALRSQVSSASIDLLGTAMPTCTSQPPGRQHPHRTPPFELHLAPECPETRVQQTQQMDHLQSMDKRAEKVDVSWFIVTSKA